MPKRLSFLAIAATLAMACQPTQSAAPTSAPPTAKPAAAASPTAAAKPVASPAASPPASPAASPAASPSARPAAAASPSPAAQGPYDPSRIRQKLGSVPTFNEQQVANFYRDKTITILIGSSAGGGYDAYARFLARHLGEHIPGNPNVIAQNMPGAGGVVAVNHLYNQVERDGTTLAIVQRGLPMEELLGGEAIRFTSSELGWLGSMNDEVSVCIARSDSPVQTFQDVFTQTLRVGGTGGGADTDVFPNFLNGLLGTQFEVIQGYPGGNEINLAMERGEIQGRCGFSYSSYISTRQDWIERDFVNILIQLALEKHPDLPNVPLVMDFARTPEERQLMQILFSRQAMGRPIATTPGVEADRLAALRRAFNQTLTDPDFLREAQQADLEVNPVSGAAVQQIVKEIAETPPHLVERMRELVRE